MEGGRNSLNFIGCDPGAVRHGNFINYYKFNSVDNRLKLLPEDIWTINNHGDLICLDIGCNSGDLTQELYKCFVKNCIRTKCNNGKEEIKQECYLLGIDLDPTLVSRAVENNQYPNNVSYYCENYMSEGKNFISTYLTSYRRDIFDIIFCFSVTMWIHINHGDEGLRHFLKKMSKQTKMLVIEPQPWKCYRTAVRRLKRSGEDFCQFPDLKIRNNVTVEIENILCNECNFIKIKETENTEWGRKLQFFKRQ
ncbi:hypothetical protein L9F63_006485 [Diploptera punctata]|uniref:RNA methyltransferase n=1 Tax=Diploptera punctata TaxID=6984 RepID=A0AAD8E4X9_DIPPU|nr:hypothetical protein L9F63_006485 [Diploptera punctata]